MNKAIKYMRGEISMLKLGDMLLYCLPLPLYNLKYYAVIWLCRLER